MEVLVAMKVVPKPEEVTVNPQTMTIDRAKARSEINPSDMAAIEAALELKDRYGARVTALSMGPPFAEKYLRVALAMGCDDAVLLTDRALAGADTLATSYTLAKAIDAIGKQDIIICGEESSDGATGQVPPGIAEWLDMAQATYCSSVDVDSARKRLVARRALRGVQETISVPLPAVVSVLSGSAEPRFMDIDRKRIQDASCKVRVLSAKDIGVDPQRIGFAGSPTTVGGVKQLKTKERKRQRVEGTPEEKAEKVWREIQQVI